MVVRLMEMFNKEVNDYDELLNKRKEINELFKNAHDAYADNVELDYFRQEKRPVFS